MSWRQTKANGNSMADGCVLRSMVYQWLKMRHQTMFYKMLNQLLKNPAVMLQSTDVAIDRTHWIGKAYTDKTSEMKCKSIIVWFTTFRHRTMFYHSRKNLKRNVKVKLDLTKKRFLFFTEPMQLVKNNEAVKFVMADITCRLKVVFKDCNSLFLVIVIIYVIF